MSHQRNTWSVEYEQTQLRMQATFLDWKTANKILKLIRNSVSDSKNNGSAVGNG